jgi:CheY-like chemotaxis protein
MDFPGESTMAATDKVKDEHVLRVLVVEDNKDAADSLSMLLRIWGYEHRVAYDGAAGLNAARSYQPNCLILDIGLPRINGYDLARQVRKEPGLAHAKLVALSAYSGEAHSQQVKAAGFDFHLVKPAAPAELERILTMLDEVVRIANRTEDLARQNVALATETKELLKGVKADLRDVKNEVRELREELREVKEERTDGAPPSS